MDIHTIVSITTVILTPMIAVFGFMLRRAFMKLDQTVSKQEVRMLIDDKLSPIVVELKFIKADLDKQNQLMIRTIEVLEQIRVAYENGPKR